MKTYSYKGFEIVKSETSGNWLVYKAGQRVFKDMTFKTLESAKLEIRVEIESAKLP